MSVVDIFVGIVSEELDRANAEALGIVAMDATVACRRRELTHLRHLSKGDN
jgi:hypothetical protein